MNIFYLDECPIKAAQAMCNRHVLKMVLESGQLLCSAHHYYPNADNKYIQNVYLLTHKNHPCSIWVRTSIHHYNWLMEHAKALCAEYTFRYEKEHLTEQVLRLLDVYQPSIPDVGWSEPPKCMPLIYHRSSTVDSYRAYYRLDKMRNIDCRWKKREKPQWA